MLLQTLHAFVLSPSLEQKSELIMKLLQHNDPDTGIGIPISAPHTASVF